MPRRLYHRDAAPPLLQGHRSASAAGTPLGFRRDAMPPRHAVTTILWILSSQSLCKSFATSPVQNSRNKMWTAKYLSFFYHRKIPWSYIIQVSPYCSHLAIWLK
jgi:hypothetical protein